MSKPIKNCFECSGDKSMSHCPTYYEDEGICTYRKVVEKDWAKYLKGEEPTTMTTMLKEFIKKNNLDEISIVSVGKDIELSDKVSQYVAANLDEVTDKELDNSRLVLLVHGDFKEETKTARDRGFRGPIAVYSDDKLAKKYATKMGIDEVCSTKEDIYNLILKYAQ